MFQHPSRHYIHYLWSKRGMNAEMIVQHLDELDLPLPQDLQELLRFTETMIESRKRMLIPPDFDPTAELLNKATIEFLTTWRIHDMWKQSEFVSRAVDVLFEPQIRRMIEAFLLGPIPHRAIAARVANRFGLSEKIMNVQVVKSYAHYFWDPQALSVPMWKRVIAKWMPPDCDNGDLLMAVSAPRGPVGAAMVLALADRGTESLKSGIMYAAMRDYGFAAFMKHALLTARPSLSHTQAMMGAFLVVKQANEELVKERGGSADLLDELKRIQTTYDSSKVTSVQDLPHLLADNTIETEGEPVPKEEQ